MPDVTMLSCQNGDVSQIAFEFVGFPAQPVLDEKRIRFNRMKQYTGANADAVECDFCRGVALFGEFRVVNFPSSQAQARLDTCFDEVGGTFAIGMLTVDGERGVIVPQTFVPVYDVLCCDHGAEIRIDSVSNELDFSPCSRFFW